MVDVVCAIRVQIVMPAFSFATPLTHTSRPSLFSKSVVFNQRTTHHIASPTRPARISPTCSTTNPPTRSLEQLCQDVLEASEEAVSKIEQVETSAALNEIRIEFLGKKAGRISTVLKFVGKLPKEQRPQLGDAVNRAKEKVTSAIEARKEHVQMLEKQRKDEEEIVDVTLPGIRPRPMTGRIHPLNSTMDLAIEIFTDLGYEVVDDPKYNREIETDYYCFEALNCPKDHPARTMQDTLYLEEDQSVLLRTQTSSVQVRYMEDNKPPFAIIAPGRVFRRDAVDATHSPQFHQIEILAVEEGHRLTLGALRATIDHFLKRMLGDDIKTRYRGSYFPFTEPSMEVDVFFRGKWLEVLGCGMVDPGVLEKAGIDPDTHQGFAAGFGVERFAMVMHEIHDIREFYKNDLRFLEQFMHDG